MLNELELNELLKTLQTQYKELTIEIIDKVLRRDDYTDEFIAQNKIHAQIDLLHHIIESNGKASLAEKAEHN